mgnify:CR=1 FL=1
MDETVDDTPFRILSLDGGGAKGFYTLGVLREVEALVGCPLSETFDLIYGTSTGSIIGAMLATGKAVGEIHDLYRKYVPDIMKLSWPSQKSAKLAELSDEIFGEDGFDTVKTAVGIVATKWIEETPLIFKSDPCQALGRQESFVPGFGATLGEAVQASCSAYPYFHRKLVTLPNGEKIEALDGGYCANNPTLYALADAVHGFKVKPGALRVLNVGVGDYPTPKVPFLSVSTFLALCPSTPVAHKAFNVNTQSMAQLRSILFPRIDTVRVSDAFTEPTMATDMFEHNIDKLNLIHRRGRESYGRQEAAIRQLLS